MITGVVPSSPRFLPSIFIAHRVQQYHCSSIFHRVLLTHALPLSASQFVHKKKSPRIYTSMHSGGFELTKLIYTRPEDNLIRHRGDRPTTAPLLNTFIAPPRVTPLICFSYLFICLLVRSFVRLFVRLFVCSCFFFVITWASAGCLLVWTARSKRGRRGPSGDPWERTWRSTCLRRF